MDPLEKHDRDGHDLWLGLVSRHMGLDVHSRHCLFKQAGRQAGSGCGGEREGHEESVRGVAIRCQSACAIVRRSRGERDGMRWVFGVGNVLQVRESFPPREGGMGGDV